MQGGTGQRSSRRAGEIRRRGHFEIKSKIAIPKSLPSALCGVECSQCQPAACGMCDSVSQAMVASIGRRRGRDQLLQQPHVACSDPICSDCHSQPAVALLLMLPHVAVVCRLMRGRLPLSLPRSLSPSLPGALLIHSTVFSTYANTLSYLGHISFIKLFLCRGSVSASAVRLGSSGRPATWLVGAFEAPVREERINRPQVPGRAFPTD